MSLDAVSSPSDNEAFLQEVLDKLDPSPGGTAHRALLSDLHAEPPVLGDVASRVDLAHPAWGGADSAAWMYAARIDKGRGQREAAALAVLSHRPAGEAGYYGWDLLPHTAGSDANRHIRGALKVGIEADDPLLKEILTHGLNYSGQAHLDAAEGAFADGDHLAAWDLLAMGASWRSMNLGEGGEPLVERALAIARAAEWPDVVSAVSGLLVDA